MVGSDQVKSNFSIAVKYWIYFHQLWPATKSNFGCIQHDQNPEEGSFTINNTLAKKIKNLGRLTTVRVKHEISTSLCLPHCSESKQNCNFTFRSCESPSGFMNRFSSQRCFHIAFIRRSNQEVTVVSRCQNPTCQAGNETFQNICWKPDRDKQMLTQEAQTHSTTTL